MKTINERLNYIIQQKGMNYSSFAETISSSGQVVRSICTGKNKPSCDIMQSIYTNHPEVDPLWFAIGIGEYFKHDTSKDKDLVIELKREVEILAKNNDSLLKDKERLWTMVETTGLLGKQSSNEYPQVESNLIVLDMSEYKVAAYKEAV